MNPCWSLHCITNESGLSPFIHSLKGVLNRNSGPILLKGDLGAGKTTFVKHWAKLLNPKILVQSPTFGLVHEYVGPNEELLIVHMDLYRLQSAHEFWNMGAGDYLDSDACVCIEWPQILEPYLKQEPHLVLEIKNLEAPDFRLYSLYQYL